MNKKKIIHLTILILTFMFVLTGCSVDSMKVKAGLKNTDFEYMTQNKVKQIIIQSTRDSRFRFVVTDKNTINDLYSMLSSAKVVDKKTQLDPDYIFEIHDEGDKVYKFNYIVGLQENGVGNFYDENKSYQVPKRIDNEIIAKFSLLAKPRGFETLYYDIIFKFLQGQGKEIDSSKSIGINIEDDIEVAKYVLSVDIEYFKQRLKDSNISASLVKKDKEKYNVLINIKTYGYKTTVYKSIITVKDKTTNAEVKYYVLCKNESNTWTYDISKTRQKDF